MVKLNQDVSFEYFVGEFQEFLFFEYEQYFLSESPPLAELFAECEWRDWVNEDYPNKRS